MVNIENAKMVFYAVRLWCTHSVQHYQGQQNLCCCHKFLQRRLAFSLFPPLDRRLLDVNAFRKLGLCKPAPLPQYRQLVEMHMGIFCRE